MYITNALHLFMPTSQIPKLYGKFDKSQNQSNQRNFIFIDKLNLRLPPNQHMVEFKVDVISCSHKAREASTQVTMKTFKNRIPKNSNTLQYVKMHFR